MALFTDRYGHTERNLHAKVRIVRMSADKLERIAEATQSALGGHWFAVDRLPPSLQELAELLMLGLPIQECARILECDVRTVNRKKDMLAIFVQAMRREAELEPVYCTLPPANRRESDERTYPATANPAVFG